MVMEMEDSIKYQGLRRHLVELLKSKGIDSKTVLKAVGSVPRQYFMDQSLINFSYEDLAYPISSNQTISQPFTVAFQTQLLEIETDNKILEIGTGSGYQTAILLELSSQIYTIERQQKLFKKTQRLFKSLGLRPKKIIFGDGILGLADDAPFDRILVTAGASQVPKNLLDQLKIGGKLVIPVGLKEQEMLRFTRIAEKEFNKESFGKFRFVPLLNDKN